MMFDNRAKQNMYQLNEQDSSRNKRSNRARLLKGFYEIGKSAGKYSKPALKYGGKALKYGSKLLKTGAKVASSDFGLGVLESVLESRWNMEDALDSNEESERNGRRNEYRRVETQIEEFRRDVNSLLYSNQIQGYIEKTPQIRKIVDGNSKTRASDVKCIKDDFTGVYSIRLQLEIDEKITVVARRCADIGENLSDQKIYEYYEFPNQFLVERNGKSFSVNTTMCSNSSPPFCPKSSLKTATCSVMFVQDCEKRFKHLDEKQKITRILPTGIVYYGPSEVLTLKTKGRSLKFSINPHHLEYIRISEGDKICIGDDVVYE